MVINRLGLLCIGLVFVLTLGFTLHEIEADGPPQVGITLVSNFDSNENVITHDEMFGAYGSRLSLASDLAEAPGYSFAFWLVNDTVRFNLEKAHEFILTKDIKIDAVFHNTTDDEYAVLFMDANGKLIGIQHVEQGEDAADITGDLPDKPGYQIAGNRWSAPLTNITENTVLILQYEINETAAFELTVIGGSGDGDYPYGSIATVTPDPGAFSHWEIGGEIVSFVETYEFSMLMDRTVTAIFKEPAEAEQPLIWLSEGLALRLGRKSYIGQFHLPEGYELIDYGIVSGDGSAALEVFDIGTKHFTGFKYFGRTNEFLMTFATHPVSLRAYLTVKHGDDEMITVYSRQKMLIPELVSVGDVGITYTVPTGYDDDSTAEVDGGFLMATTQTTYMLWYAVREWAEANGYQFFNRGWEGISGQEGAAPSNRAQEPVVGVNWAEAVIWLNALSEMHGLDPVYRDEDNNVLRNSFPDEMATQLVAWYYDNSDTGEGRKTQPVGQLLPNHLGIYDMNGNVTERTYTTSGSERIFRGGGWAAGVPGMQVGVVISTPPCEVNHDSGFRFVRNP